MISVLLIIIGILSGQSMKLSNKFFSGGGTQHNWVGVLTFKPEIGLFKIAQIPATFSYFEKSRSLRCS